MSKNCIRSRRTILKSAALVPAVGVTGTGMAFGDDGQEVTPADETECSKAWSAYDWGGVRGYGEYFSDSAVEVEFYFENSDQGSAHVEYGNGYLDTVEQEVDLSAGETYSDTLDVTEDHWYVELHAYDDYAELSYVEVKECTAGP